MRDVRILAGRVVCFSSLLLALTSCDAGVVTFCGVDASCTGPIASMPAVPACQIRAPGVVADPSPFLVGDTITLSSACPLLPRWSRVGDAVALVSRRGGMVADTSLAHAVVATCTQRGSTTVSATWSTGAKAAVTLRVQDSVDVARIQLTSAWERYRQLKAGGTLPLRPTLLDAYGNLIRGRPERLWSSDTTVASVESGAGDAEPAPTVRARSPGTAYVVASFLNVRDTLWILVIR